MRILYAVQATGNGHLSRAIHLGPALADIADVDYLISGRQGDLDIGLPIKHRYTGASFFFGKTGGIDWRKTWAKARPVQLIKDAMQVPLENYDLIVNDYEPVTAWALRWQPEKIISVSHQAAVLAPGAPRPTKTSRVMEGIIKTYAPVKNYLGLHFQAYAPGVTTPIIRHDIRELLTDRRDFVTVYLPAYGLEQLAAVFSQISDIRWRVYVKGLESPKTMGNIDAFPVGHNSWHRSFAEAEAVILGGGFESPSEALHLGKKLMVIPMQGQYEQQCNAAALRQLGVSVLDHLDQSEVPHITAWLKHGSAIHIPFPDHTDFLVQHIMDFAKERREKSSNILMPNPT